MPRGKNYVNNNKGLTMQRHKKETHMEKCFYGAGCTRPDCKYLHPSPITASEQSTKKSNEPCMPYLAGLCTFTAQGCHKRHPPQDEVEKLIAKYRRLLCRFGESCKTSGCLYVHPGEEGADELLKLKQQALVVPAGLNSPGFPPLKVAGQMNGSSMLQAARSSQSQQLPPNSAWKPSPPTGHAMAQSALLLQQRPLTMPVRPGMLPPRLVVSTSSALSSNIHNKSLSVHAKEFMPSGGSF
jgi:hypothetical protein